MARQIVVDIVGDSSKFSKSVDDATSVGGRFTNVVKGIGMGIGTGLFDLATGAVMNFVGALGDAGEAYREDQREQVILNTALKNAIPNWDGNTDAINEYIDAQAARGFADGEVRDSIGQLVGITHDATKATELSSLAQDLARAKNISLAEATDIVTKAAQGNGKALKALGIDTTGVADAAGYLDAIQKNVTGSADAWAQTSEGKVAAANIKQAEAWERIGGVVDKITQVVLPIAAEAFSAIADVITGVAAAVEPVIAAIGERLGPAFTGMSPILTEMGGTFQSIFDSIQTIVTSVVKIVQGIWDRFGSNIMTHIKTALDFVTNTFRNAFKVVEGIFDVFAGIFSGDWDRVWKGVKSIFTGIWDQIQNAFRTVVSLIQNGLDAFGKVVKSIWDGILSAVKGAITTFVGFFTSLPGKISNAVGNLFDGIPKAFKAALNWLIRMWNNLEFRLGPFDLGPLGAIGPWTLSTPNLPYFHQGGLVPGTPGQDVLAVLQAGERVIPANGAGASGITIVVNGDVYGDGIDALADKLALRLRLAGA